ncbi:hypothetical protein Glove_360g132 [Diversispora epigaea]|uniref:Ion transport domain-containing protein n=1 Tax=Diversispora epigaea TaxID=1348612 RepID=A0A397HHJ0_9GLOM|nr:hypothetical protein Glove_360g132 [Diversispora epigaea]
MFFIYISLILHFRVFRAFGIPIYIVRDIFRKVWLIIIIMGLMVFSFAHILNILLRDTENDDYKLFTNSIVSVFFIMIGQFDSVGAEIINHNKTIIILLMVFSFSTTILLLNVLIAMMSDVVAETKTTGKRAWLKQKAEVIAEIEMFLMTPEQRKRKDYFPSLIYYHASPDTIKAYRKSDYENNFNDDGWIDDLKSSKKSDLNDQNHSLVLVNSEFNNFGHDSESTTKLQL